MHVELVPITNVIVGRRHRGDNGDLSALMTSIDSPVGLLHPVGVNSRLELVFGGRRLEACRRLGWEKIPAHVIASLDDAAEALRAERDENSCRLDMKPTELVAIGRDLEEVEREAAKKRQATTGTAPGKPKNASGKLPEALPGDTRDKMGEALGVSGSTYEKAKKVVEAAEADPDQYGDLPDLMDAKSVDAAHKELKARIEVTDDDTEQLDDTSDVHPEPIPPPSPPPPYYPIRPKGAPPPPKPEYTGELDKVMKLLTQTATALTRFVRSDEKAAKKFVFELNRLGLKWVLHDWQKGSILDQDTGEYGPLGDGPVYTGLRPLRRLLAVCHKNRRFTVEQVREIMTADGEILSEFDTTAEV